MQFNNAPVVLALAGALEPSSRTIQIPTSRRRVFSEPCLPERLPTTSFIQREAENLAPKAVSRHILHISPPSVEQVAEIQQVPAPRIRRLSESLPSPSSLKSLVQSFMTTQPTKSPTSWSGLQPYEVMKAVEQRDIMFLMQVRDNAFHLLLQSSGGETPLVHAIRIGNKDVAIVLLGAFSRWVNYLEDQDLRNAQTQTYLKALRVGLKLAINEDLANSQADLIASFMQTLIMSEGDKWVWAQVSTVSRALNSGMEGKPVHLAGASVRRFATKELGKADLIASLEDYIANATADLLMMGAWSVVLQSIAGDKIPSYYFARDDRVYKAFVDRIDRHKTQIQSSCSRRLKWQLRVLRDTLEGRTITFRRKVELLVSQLDEGDGV